MAQSRSLTETQPGGESEEENEFIGLGAVIEGFLVFFFLEEPRGDGCAGSSEISGGFRLPCIIALKPALMSFGNGTPTELF